MAVASLAMPRRRAPVSGASPPLPLIRGRLRHLLNVLAATVLTNVGKQVTVGRIMGGVVSPNPGWGPPRFVGWGSGAGTAVQTATALFAEEAEARVQGGMQQITTTTTGDTFQVIASLTALVAKSITNAGLFDTPKAQGAAVPVGNCYMLGDFAAVPLNAGESIGFTMQVQYQ